MQIINNVLAFVQLLTFFPILVFEYNKKYVSIFMWATLLVMFGIPHWISVFLGNYIYPPLVYFKSSIFVILFNCMYFLFRFLYFQSSSKTMDTGLKNEQKKHIDIINRTFLMVIIYTIVYLFILRFRYESLSKITWGILYTDSISIYEKGDLFGKILLLDQYIALGLGGFILYYHHLGYYFKMVVASVLVLLFVFITRNRILILPLLTSIIIVFILKKRNITVRDIILLSVIGFVSLYLVYALRLFRHYGSFNDFINNVNLREFNINVFENLLNGDGELGLRNVFLFFIYNKNDFLNFNRGHTYRRLLLFLIPTRYSLGLKPPDFAITMGTAWIGNYYNTSYSVHPTLYGDIFANFYWLGMFFSVFWVVLAIVIDRIIMKKRKSPMLFIYISVFANMFVIVARGSVYNGIVFSAISVIIYRIIMSLSQILPKIKFR